jgi:signal transduction histidine kinase
VYQPFLPSDTLFVAFNREGKVMESSESTHQVPSIEGLNKVVKQLSNAANEKIKIHDIFQSIHKKMVRGMDYQEILNFLFSSLNTVLPYDRMGIAVLEENDTRIKLNWVMSKNPVTHLKQDYSDVIAGSSLEEVIKSEKPRIIKDLVQYQKEHPQSRSTALAIKDGIMSNLTGPLFVDGKVVGVIFFSSTEPYTYEESHIELFGEISEGISVIVGQGLLRKTLKENTAKEKLFRHTIHELNNPLGVIKGVLDLIGQKEWFSQLSEESKSVFQILKKKNEAMITLVRDLTLMNQIQGSMAIEKKKVVLNEFLEETIVNGEMLAKGKNIKIELFKEGPLPAEVYFDSLRIMQALENLLANAIKYSSPKTKVTVSISANEEEHKLFFSVKDQGPGIPEGELEKLFTEYGKTSVRPTDGELSSGLGLAIVKYVVESHKGKVSVTSRVGVGSTFSFWIPYSES